MVLYELRPWLRVNTLSVLVSHHSLILQGLALVLWLDQGCRTDQP